MRTFFCILYLGFTLRLFAQGEYDGLRERMYLQTDKQLYLSGELAWMKVMTITQEGLPLSFSKVAYIELLDATNAQVQIKVELSDGTGAGWIQLPVDLPTGYYRLVAYTRFMRNETPEVFFEKSIGVVNTFQPAKAGQNAAGNPLLPMEETSVNTFSLQTDQSVYAVRDKGELKLDGLPENIHTLSVTIAGNDPLPIPGEYIQQWKKRLSGTGKIDFSGIYLPEYEGHIITGKIANIRGNDYSDDDNTLPFLSFLGDKIRFFSGKKEFAGNVFFYTSGISGTTEVATTINHPENLYRVDVLSPFIRQHPIKKMPALPIDSIPADWLLKRNIALQALYAYTGDSIVNQSPSDTYYKTNPDATYVLDEYTRFTSMEEIFVEFIQRVRFRNDNGKKRLSVITKKGDTYDQGIPLVLLDGIPVMDHNIIFNYNPHLVQRIDLYFGTYTIGNSVFGGIIQFSTYRHDYPGLTMDQSTQIINYEGTQAHRRFYTPQYLNEEDRRSRVADFRHTLLWDPNIRTEGKPSVRIPFYTSDHTGEFKVTVEGLTKTGEIVFAQTRFTVQ